MILYSDTRWNSLLHMLERLVQLKDFIPLVDNSLLTQEDWKKIEKAVEFLKPFEKVRFRASKILLVLLYFQFG